MTTYASYVILNAATQDNTLSGSDIVLCSISDKGPGTADIIMCVHARVYLHLCVYVWRDVGNWSGCWWWNINNGCLFLSLSVLLSDTGGREDRLGQMGLLVGQPGWSKPAGNSQTGRAERDKKILEDSTMLQKHEICVTRFKDFENGLYER